MEETNKDEIQYQICFIHKSFIKSTKDIKEVMEPKDIRLGSIFTGTKGRTKAYDEANRLSETYPTWKYFVREIEV